VLASAFVAMQENIHTEDSARGRKKPLRVFLVEDYPPVRELIIETLLEIAGLEVAGFADTESGALSWLDRNACDVLILDLELRRGNGLGVLKALSAPQNARGLVKIVYSNHAGDNVRQLAAQFGATHFFDKTMDPRKLRQLLEELAASAP